MVFREEGVFDQRFFGWRELLGEDDVELDNEVAGFAVLARDWHSFAEDCLCIRLVN